MLGQRVLTALVLIAVLAGVLLSGSFWLFVAVLSLIMLTAAWEWDRMQKNGWGQSVLGVIVFSALLITLISVLRERVFFRAHFGDVWLIFGTLFWIAALLGINRLDPQPGARGRMTSVLAGVIVLSSAWVGAVTLYQFKLQLLLAVVAVPVIADTAAYFVGRQFGKRKLAPKISPGKTIEGAIGGFVGVLLCLGAWVVYAGWPLWTIAAFGVLALFSIVGDLYESVLKRQSGVKDSSNLLPGHGGVLDRIDAQLPVLTIGALIFSLFSIS